MLGCSCISSDEEHVRVSSGRYFGNFSGARLHSLPSRISPATDVSKKYAVMVSVFHGAGVSSDE